MTDYENLNLTAGSTDAELRAAAERYAAHTYEQPDSVLARLQDAQWELRDIGDPNPGLPAPTFTVTPWSDDVDLMEVLDELGAAYPGVNRRVLAGVLRDLRWHLREATAASAVALVQPVVDRLADLILAETGDDEIVLMTLGAEAAHGGPIPGLMRELVALRDAARRECRVFVSGPGYAPRIGNFGDPSVA